MEERCSEKVLYMCQVLKHEDPVRQEATLHTVPVDELKEKALISLAKIHGHRQNGHFLAVYYFQISCFSR